MCDCLEFFTKIRIENNNSKMVVSAMVKPINSIDSVRDKIKSFHEIKTISKSEKTNDAYL